MPHRLALLGVAPVTKDGLGPPAPPPPPLSPLLATCHGQALLGSQPVGDALDAVLLAASGFAVQRGNGELVVHPAGNPSQVWCA